MKSLIDEIKDIHDIDSALNVLKREIDFTPKVQKAFDFAKDAHKGQFRKSGEPYVVHPILVAVITAWISNNEDMVIAALLHDVVEDTQYCLEDISKTFSDEVSLLVDGLTKFDEIREDELIPSTSNEKLLKSALTFRKMLLISIKDLRVLIIKLCDRLHNMLTLDALAPNKQQRIAEETLIVYAPIAHRLGISKIKNYLEDLSFKYIYPDEYKFIDDYIKSHTQDLNLRLNHIIEKSKELLNKNGFPRNDIEIFGRVKHYYSIYQKMQRKGVNIEEILDLLAIRVIVKEPELCYKALGVFHLNFSPIVARFKDYIALPKDNGYQTLHTTLFFDDDIVEVQIRTEHMHKVAEYGIAAHWKYKEGDAHINLDWISNLPYQSESVEHFYESAKADLFSEDIVVFSPKGDSYTLPKGAVVLDYAYAVHSDVGHLATAALVNKEKTSLLKILKNGDIVEIIKQDKPRLHCSWIDTVKTSKAKEAIRAICKQRLNEINKKIAYRIIATIFNMSLEETHAIVGNLGANNISKITTNLDSLKEKIKKVAKVRHIHDENFFSRLRYRFKKPILKEVGFFRFFTNKHIERVDFDYCCHPKLGDEIVAFYNKGEVVIHHKLCSKAQELINKQKEVLFVEWNSNQSAKYRLIVALQNKKGALLELLKEIDKLNLNIISIELSINNPQQAEYCKIEVETTQDNQNKIKDIISSKFRLIDFISLKDAYKK